MDSAMPERLRSLLRRWPFSQPIETFEMLIILRHLFQVSDGEVRNFKVPWPTAGAALQALLNSDYPAVVRKSINEKWRHELMLVRRIHKIISMAAYMLVCLVENQEFELHLEKIARVIEDASTQEAMQAAGIDGGEFMASLTQKRRAVMEDPDLRGARMTALREWEKYFSGISGVADLYVIGNPEDKLKAYVACRSRVLQCQHRWNVTLLKFGSVRIASRMPQASFAYALSAFLLPGDHLAINAILKNHHLESNAAAEAIVGKVSLEEIEALLEP